MYIYADNAGTTKMSPVAIDAMTKCMNEVFGNPSSLHSTGQRAAEVLQKAQKRSFPERTKRISYTIREVLRRQHTPVGKNSPAHHRPNGYADG